MWDVLKGRDDNNGYSKDISIFLGTAFLVTQLQSKPFQSFAQVFNSMEQVVNFLSMSRWINEMVWLCENDTCKSLDNVLVEEYKKWELRNEKWKKGLP